MKKRLLGILLSFALMLTMIPGMGLTAYAADYETIDITSAVYDATSVSKLINSLDGFSKLSSEEAESWVPPTGSGNERLILDYEGEDIYVARFENGTRLSNAYISLAMAKQYDGIKYYYAKKTVVAVNSVTLSPATVTLTEGGEAVAMTATVSPDNATDKTVIWSSDNPAVASVSDGVVTAVAEGTATITVTATNGTEDTSDDKTATCAVTVKEKSAAAQSTITYDLNGGTLNGETGKVAVKVNNGTVITLPEPARDGYTFDYWEGSKYNAGDKYTVNGDHTFKAVWKTAASGDGSKGGSSKKGVNTGDENTLGAWIVLLVAALAGTTGMAFARKRRND